MTGTALECLEGQDTLGWDLPFSGMWSQTWCDVQDQHYHHSQSKRSGQRWLSQTIRELWTFAFQLWTDRNDILHAKERQAQFSAISQQIREVYAKDHRMYPQYLRRRLQRPLAQLLAAPLSDQQLWLSAFRAYQKAGMCLRNNGNAHFNLLRSLQQQQQFTVRPLPMPDAQQRKVNTRMRL